MAMVETRQLICPSCDVSNEVILVGWSHDEIIFCDVQVQNVVVEVVTELVYQPHESRTASLWYAIVQHKSTITLLLHKIL